MKSLAILGSTGSVGKSTLDVIRKNKDEFKIELLTARSNFRLMAEQCIEFTPKFIKNVFLLWGVTLAPNGAGNLLQELLPKFIHKCPSTMGGHVCTQRCWPSS